MLSYFINENKVLIIIKTHPCPSKGGDTKIPTRNLMGMLLVYSFFDKG
jgi:hypothetical protein